jgi:hypothetical protein
MPSPIDHNHPHHSHIYTAHAGEVYDALAGLRCALSRLACRIHPRDGLGIGKSLFAGAWEATDEFEARLEGFLDHLFPHF